jgi:hypothetical protein
MKKTWIVLMMVCCATASFAQQYRYFGDSISAEGAIAAQEAKALAGDVVSGELKLAGQVAEVCQAKGCWMTLDAGSGETIRVKFKDYGFFVPKDLAGSNVVLLGKLQRETLSVDMLKHLAEDADKPQDEIDNIDTPQESLTFVASGVLVK